MLKKARGQTNMADVIETINDFVYTEQQYLRNQCRYCDNYTRNTMCETCAQGFDNYEESRQDI